MTSKFAAYLTAATIALGASAPAAHAMGMEFNMLTGAVFNELRARSLPTDNIDNLTLGQIAIIKSILDGDDSEGQKTNRIKVILER